MDGEVSPDEVRELLESDDPPRIVDIRSPAAFRRGHIPSSENVPFQELPQRIEALSGSERIVTVCPHGKASVQAARLIKSYEGTATARVESMSGGLTEWPGDLETDDEPDPSSGARPESAAADEGPEAPF